MSSVLIFVTVVTIVGVLGSVSGSVSQCYHCNSQYCGDPYNSNVGAVTSCSDIYKNARLYSSEASASASVSSAALKMSNDYQVGSNNSQDIETLSSEDTNEIVQQRTHADFFDIQRKIWELFNKGEIDQYTQFVCVKANYYTENGEYKTYRSCVPKYTKSISTACDFVKQKVVGASTSTVYGCYSCESNFCNSGISLKTSLLAFVVGIILKVTI